MTEAAREVFVYNGFKNLKRHPGGYVESSPFKFFNNSWVLALHVTTSSIIITLKSIIREDVKIDEFSMECINMRHSVVKPITLTPHNKFGFEFGDGRDIQDTVVKIELSGLRRKTFNYLDYVNDIGKPLLCDDLITIFNKDVKLVDNFVDYYTLFEEKESKQKMQRRLKQEIKYQELKEELNKNGYNYKMIDNWKKYRWAILEILRSQKLDKLSMKNILRSLLED